MDNTNIEFHIVQTFPVTCLNRDLNGTPKTAIIGDTLRARVSSQAWKRAIRMEAKKLDPKAFNGSRSKRHWEDLEVLLRGYGCPEEVSGELSQVTMDELTGGDSLIYLSASEILSIAEGIKGLASGEDATPWDKFVIKTTKKVKGRDETSISLDTKITSLVGKIPHSNAVDIALFGRMLAKAKSLNIEAACSVAHAISTHEVVVESDFFTAVDDKIKESDEMGAGHLGVTEFTSATYYRYFSLNLPTLVENLKGFSKEDILQAIKVFVEAILAANPSARQTTMSGQSSWDMGIAIVRKSQPIQLNWSEAIRVKRGEGFSDESVRLMKDKLSEAQKRAGSYWGEVGRAQHDSENDRDIFIKGLLSIIEKEL